jgi:acetylornithine deacetylase/succinyl-diaminopimelate desuccinylase-like protein
MPFRPWTRWKFPAEERQLPPDGLAQEVARLSADSRVHQLFDWFLRHEREIAEFQLAVTAVPAPTFDEQVRAEWMRERLEKLGLEIRYDAVGNLLASRPGLQPDLPAIGLSAHLDTVFPLTTPLDVRREQARLLGPGISDNGSGLAALWAVAAAFHAAGIVTSTPLLFIANVGEEGEGNLRGMRHIYRERLEAEDGNGEAPAPALLIAVDGAGCDSIISQALGSRRFEIVITGPGGHSWSDHGTPNPIVAAGLLIEKLYRIPLPVNPRTTLNVGTMEGGTSVNTIPERAVLKVDLRSSDSRRLDDLEQQLRRAVADACATTEASAHRGRLSRTITNVGERPAGELPATSPLLAAVRAVDTQLGIRSQILRASTDANVPLSMGLEAVTLGAGGNGGGAHTVHEWFDPGGREHGLRRLALLVLLLAGLTPDEAKVPGSTETV